MGATLDTAGLGDDALHVLDLPLTAGEGAELDWVLAFGSGGFVCWWRWVGG